MAKLDFSKIDDMLKSSLDFTLTETQYEKLVNHKMPKDASYLTNRSAIANHAKQLGLRIKLQEKSIRFEREKK